ncbi:hypothetical protein IU500_31295 [Nocardia terpenica]|uniref:hypothetical protein n=1 Tax=Nocardia terpenica TaxID=455432 RepID=UPI001892F4F3|nr:hypothetical protein [Nocardia terpenica]MBF6063843.1 hypothetical protein [Nocardia terpenica]MBF6108505.1 hypothetical protein [Nocardia terpenica]MBF6116051.1 hypothetical protein [Nocardia terpenica]MBF6121024.1 hypothetical protein [Nocardia terpenica]MBF6156704.1 hypothetical protein [Nocardia terpenica]
MTQAKWAAPGVCPAVALRWLREHPEAAVAPMHLPTLLEQCTLPEDLQAAVLRPSRSRAS